MRLLDCPLKNSHSLTTSLRIRSLYSAVKRLQEEEKIYIGNHESMCNPIGQAMILNDARTDFNIMFCLCVGHDSLFLEYIKGLTTVLAAKDRVTGHNPMAALYTANSYYQKLKKVD